ncbi:hypothetical protein [Pseudomonas fluorescens]|uniref:hypothetical protein n=1 Tax=Pseudomonas fluorescens TaxID=294 RepID=UPI00069B39D3|nr:hypothetical protein [Pseudomonas fluorescens]
MHSKRNKISAALTSFWFFSSSTIVISLVIAIWVYRLKFGGVLSDNSSDWSNFGSYMGGIFGPLVSFVTLLAVLKTVYLQRELLDAQSREFDRMNVIQQQTFDAQITQNSSIAEDAKRKRVTDFQNTVLQLLNQQISLQEGIIDSIEKYEKEIYEKVGLRNDERMAAITRSIEEKGKALNVVKELSRLSVAVAMFEYKNVAQIRKMVVDKLDKVLPWFSDFAETITYEQQ